MMAFELLLGVLVVLSFSVFLCDLPTLTVSASPISSSAVGSVRSRASLAPATTLYLMPGSLLGSFS